MTKVDFDASDAEAEAAYITACTKARAAVAAALRKAKKAKKAAEEENAEEWNAAAQEGAAAWRKVLAATTKKARAAAATAEALLDARETLRKAIGQRTQSRHQRAALPASDHKEATA